MPNPRNYQFNLPKNNRPDRMRLDEEWYPGISEYWDRSTTSRIYHPINGVRAVVIHATAGSSSAGAVSVMRDAKASFHWLVPDEDEPQHGKFVWACAPETLAAWHVRNSRSHPQVWEGNNRINHWSLGIEVVNTQKSSDGISPWQIDATAQIVRYCWAKYPNLRHVVSHARMDPDRRSDPGTQFPWQTFKDAVMSDTESALPPLVRKATPASQVESLEKSATGCCTP